MSAALSSRRAASVSRCTRSRSRSRSSSWWSSSSRSLGRSGAGVSGGPGRRVGDDAAAATADDARRLAHRDADRLAGQQPALILDAHELAPLGELAEGGGHGRAARSHELGDEPVRHRHRHGDAPRHDASPALGEVPEQREDPAIDAVELGDRLGDGEPLSPLREAIDEHRVDLGEPAQQRGETAIEHRQPARSRARSSGRRRGAAAPGRAPATDAPRRPVPAARTRRCRRARPRVRSARRAGAGRRSRARRCAAAGPPRARGRACGCGRRSAASPPPAAAPKGADRGPSRARAAGRCRWPSRVHCGHIHTHTNHRPGIADC